MTVVQQALSLVDLTVSFGGLRVIDGATLSIAPDERHAILGPNGAGKTTLFNVLTGDLRPSSGKVLFFGEDVTAMPSFERVRRGIRRTYQSSLLFPGLSVRDNLLVAVHGVIAGRMSFRPVASGDPDMVETDSLLARIRLDHIAERPVAELSHGQQRQLEIGMALAGTPRMILLDEPAAGLSPGERTELITLLQSLPKSMGFVLIEHDLEIALRVVDRMTVMHNGRMIRHGAPEVVVRDPEVQAIYMGDPSSQHAHAA